MDWYKRDIGAYRRATSRLKPLAHGVYTLLLDEYYAGQGPLPDDYTALYRICGAQTDSEKKCVRNVIDQFFIRNGDGFRYNDRADEEIANYRARSATNRGIAQARYAQRNDTRIVERNAPPQEPRIVHREKERNIETSKPVDNFLERPKFLYKKPTDA